MEERSNQNWERIFNLFKLEYEQAAERFENIYKAIWQIFSYMGILAAGILTVGSRSSSLPVKVIVCIALTPLVFWFLAIYIPMNHYGYKVGEHLEKMEYEFNNISKDFLNPPWELKHYRNFAARKKNSNSDSKKVKSPWPVKNAVYFFGGTIFIVWISLCMILLIIWFRVIPHSTNLFNFPKSSSEKIELKLEPVEVTIQEPQLQKLQNKLDSLSQ